MIHLLKRYDTFIFDWDGTLSTVNALYKLNERLNPHWIYRKRRSAEQIDKYSVSMPKDAHTIAGRAIRRHIEEKELENELLIRLIDLSIYLMRPRLHYYAREVLEKLRRSNAKIALFTNASSYRVLKELEHLKVGKYFEAIQSAQGLKTIKPNPLGLRVLLRELHSKKGKAIYIGDMVDDVEAAKYAGIDSCAIAKGFDTYDQLKSARPTYLMSSMESFMKAL